MLRLPRSFHSELQSEFHFSEEHNDERSLLHTWQEGRIFVNPLPPFRQGSIEFYVNKALRSKAELLVLLLPCDVSTDWFATVWEQVQQEPSRVSLRFFKGRVKYEGEEKTSRFQHRIPSCLVIIRNAKINAEQRYA